MSLPQSTRPAIVTAIAAVAIAAVLLIATTGLGSVDLADLPMGEPEDVGMSSAGLSSTAADYFTFHQMMLNGGELNGVRILSPRTVNLMISNHIGDKDVYVWGPGYGFGLGYSILLDPGFANEHLSPGTFFWAGAWNTLAWVDPVEDMLAVFLTQITPFSSLNVLRDVGTLASQALIESHRYTPPTVLGIRAATLTHEVV